MKKYLKWFFSEYVRPYAFVVGIVIVIFLGCAVAGSPIYTVGFDALTDYEQECVASGCFMASYVFGVVLIVNTVVSSVFEYRRKRPSVPAEGGPQDEEN